MWGGVSYLICDGTEEQYTRDNESFKIQKSLGIEVTDNKLFIDGVYFTDEKVILGSKYKKDKNKITFSSLTFLNDKADTSFDGNIDRISGQIHYEKHHVITGVSFYFDGKCRTSDKKAF